MTTPTASTHSPPKTLGERVNWAKASFGGPSDTQIWKILIVLFLSWGSIYVAAYYILEYVWFPTEESNTEQNVANTTATTMNYTMLPPNTTITNTTANARAPSRMLARATDTFWYADMDEENFATFTAFLCWGIVLVSGIGLELFVWRHLLKNGWSPQAEVLWRFAQFIFPLLGVASLGLAIHQNYLAILITVVWLWKFGFPETLLYVHTGLFHPELPTKHRIADLLNGVGSCLHHSTPSLTVCLLCAGFPHDQPWAPRTLLMSAFLAVSQHMLSPLSYSMPNVYTVLVLTLEVFFEWGLLSDIENVHKAHWMFSMLALVMLLSHWMYLLAGFLDIVPVPMSHHHPKNKRASVAHELASTEELDFVVDVDADLEAASCSGLGLQQRGQRNQN